MRLRWLGSAPPSDVVVSEETVLQPDIIVARRDELADRDLRGVPRLVVEVLLPSTRHIDRTLKVPARGGRLPVVRVVEGEQQVELTTPFPIAITPARLLE